MINSVCLECQNQTSIRQNELHLFYEELYLRPDQNEGLLFNELTQERLNPKLSKIISIFYVSLDYFVNSSCY